MHISEIWYGYSPARVATSLNILLNKKCCNMRAYKAVVLSCMPIRKWAYFTTAPGDYSVFNELGKMCFVTCLL